MTKGFVPPAYPYDLLNEMREGAVEKFGAMVDCSIGAPIDTPPAAVIEALSNSNDERGYPPANGRPAYRQAAVDWMQREFGVTIDAVTEIGACSAAASARLPAWWSSSLSLLALVVLLLVVVVVLVVVQQVHGS